MVNCKDSTTTSSDNSSDDPVLCKVRDLLRLFENYQSSKLLVWEIVRTMHPIHCASMLYIMENVMRTNKTDAFTADDDDDGGENIDDTDDIGDYGFVECPISTGSNSGTSFVDRDSDGYVVGGTDDECPEQYGRYFRADSESVPLCMRPTLGSKRCVVDRRVLPEKFDRRCVENETRDGDLTLFGLVKLMQEQRVVEPKTFAERVVMHNLRTRHYTQFADNLSSHLLPDNPKFSRFSVGANGSSRGVCHTLADTGNFESLPVRFLKFYSSFERNGNVTSTTERNSRAFRVTRRPKPRTVYVKPVADLRDGQYYVQPRYVGYRVIVNVAGSETRTFNRFGEHVQNLLYKLRFSENVHATFEAIILPVDTHGRLRSWRYKRTPTDSVLFSSSLRVVVVDVLRVHNRILVDEPFSERVGYLKKLFGQQRSESKSEQPTVVPAETVRGHDAEKLWSRLERNYRNTGSHSSFEAFEPINGLILRSASETRRDECLQYVFAPVSIYSFRTNSVTRLHGRCSLREQLDTYFHVETAEVRTTLIVYAHDEFHYYVCVYDRTTLEFVHHATLARIPKVTLEPKYRSELIYVRGARKRPAGVAYVRVYHNENDCLVATPGTPGRVILGYDQKLTTSMYDVPYVPVKWYEPNTISNPALLC